ncbi:membrane protein [Staphylococcus phage Quidividi]|nr:membrane protein [Staphylococcus phage Quidividi]
MELIEIYFIILNVLIIIIVSNIVLISFTIINKDRGDVSKYYGISIGLIIAWIITNIPYCIIVIFYM